MRTGKRKGRCCQEGNIWRARCIAWCAVQYDRKSCPEGSLLHIRILAKIFTLAKVIDVGSEVSLIDGRGGCGACIRCADAFCTVFASKALLVVKAGARCFLGFEFGCEGIDLSTTQSVHRHKHKRQGKESEFHEDLIVKGVVGGCRQPEWAR